MKLLEDMNDNNQSFKDMIVDIAKRFFGLDLDEQKAAEIVDKFSLSDVLSLDKAYSENDKFKIANILDQHMQLEYYIPGRGNLSSTASQRPANRTKSFHDMQQCNNRKEQPLYSKPPFIGNNNNARTNGFPNNNVTPPIGNNNNPASNLSGQNLSPNQNQQQPTFNIKLDKSDIDGVEPSHIDLQRKEKVPSYITQLKKLAGTSK